MSVFRIYLISVFHDSSVTTVQVIIHKYGIVNGDLHPIQSSVFISSLYGKLYIILIPVVAVHSSGITLCWIITGHINGGWDSFDHQVVAFDLFIDLGGEGRKGISYVILYHDLEAILKVKSFSLYRILRQGKHCLIIGNRLGFQNRLPAIQSDFLHAASRFGIVGTNGDFYFCVAEQTKTKEI